MARGGRVNGVVALAAAHRRGERDVHVTVEALITALDAPGDPATWIARVPAGALRARAAELAAGPQDLPLLGVPFAVKDNIDAEGLPTTAGCPSYAYAPARSAPVVARLLEAGAILAGKTNMDQFATGLVGTRSPHGACSSVASAEHIAGGSSSGSAVAVARGLVAFALGTDTAGSGRVPAAFNGVVGLKPTLGRLSVDGVVPACRTLDCVSIFTRDAADAVAVLAVAEGFEAGDPFSRRPQPGPTGRPATIGVPRADDLAALEDGPMRRAWEAAVVRATGLAELVEVDLSAFLEVAQLLYAGPWIAERYAAVGAFLERAGADVDPAVREIVLGGAALTAADAFRGVYRLAELRRRAETVWEDVDALLVPTVPRHPTHAEVAADPVGVNAELGVWTNFVNLLDLAAIAVPATVRDDGLPFGVTFVAPAWSDAALLRLATAWEHTHVDAVDVAVVGAHLSGMARNHELLALGARLVRATRTAPGYRLFDLGDGTGRPGMLRDDDGGASIDLELWRLDTTAFGRFVASIAAPLTMGTVELEDGSTVKGFLSEPHAVADADATEVTACGGWRAYREGAPV